MGEFIECSIMWVEIWSIAPKHRQFYKNNNTRRKPIGIFKNPEH